MPDLSERIERWRRFIENDRSPRFMYKLHVAEPAAPPRPLPRTDNVPARIAWAWGQYERLVRHAGAVADDTLPYLTPYTGTEIFAEAFGCPVEYPADSNPFSRPLVATAAEAGRLRVPSLDHPAIARLFAIADELHRRAPDALMQLVDIQSPMDIAALIWDKNDFYIALAEDRPAVRELAGKVHALLTAFLDEWFRRYGRSFIAHYPDYYMPIGMTLSEDEVGVVDAETFETLFLPELVALSNRYGAIGMHCCANSRHQWTGFQQIPNLRLLNLVQPREILQEGYRFFATHCAQWHAWTGDGPPETWPGQLPANARFVIDTTVKTADEAAALAQQLQTLRGRAAR